MVDFAQSGAEFGRQSFPIPALAGFRFGVKDPDMEHELRSQHQEMLIVICKLDHAGNDWSILIKFGKRSAKCIFVIRRGARSKWPA